MGLFPEKHSTLITSIIGRLIKSAKKPAAMRHSAGGANLGWGMSFQDMLDFRALESISKGKCTFSVAAQVLSSIDDGKPADVGRFEEAYGTLISLRALQKPAITQWKFVLPIHISFADTFTPPFRFSCLGVDASITTWKRLGHAFGKSRLNQALASLYARTDQIEPNYCFVFNVQAEDASRGWEQASPAFETVRGMFDT